MVCKNDCVVMQRETVLITVKAYPTLSRAHAELVCTAGVREDGTWVRIYPVPFRRLGLKNRYHKFHWVIMPLVKRLDDFRPESFSPGDFDQIEIGEKIGTENQWRLRREIILERGAVWTNLTELISASKEDKTSLATFRAARLLNFAIREADREWDRRKLDHVKTMLGQGTLFAEEELAGGKSFEIARKLPYDFSYEFEDEAGRKSKMRIIDWEIGALYWNCLANAEGDEATALEKVREKYWHEFKGKDIHLFLGTTLEFHRRNVSNPFTIVGVFYPPHVDQPSLIQSDYKR